MLANFFTAYRKDLPQSLKDSYHRDFCQSDKLMIVILTALWGITGLLIPFFFGSQMLGLVVGGAIVAIAVVSYLFLKGQLISRVIMSFGIGLFMILIVQQVGGMAEGHFMFFIGVAITLRYLDFIPILTLTVLTVVHHITFAYCQTIGLEIGGTPLIAYNWGFETELGIWTPVIVHIVAAVFEVLIGLYLVHLSNQKFYQGGLVIALVQRASQGDLSKQLNSSSSEGLLLEVGNFLNSLNVIFTDIEKNATDLDDMSVEFSTSTMQINKSTTEISEKTTAASQNINDITVSIDAVSGSIDTIGDNTLNISSAIDEMTENIGSISGAALEMKENISSVSQSIEKVLGSNQTVATMANDAFIIANQAEQISEDVDNSMRNLSIGLTPCSYLPTN